MKNRQYIEALAEIHEWVSGELRNLSVSDDANDKEKWLPKAEKIMEERDRRMDSMPTEVED